MALTISVRCALCGKDIPVDGERYSIGHDIICTDCAETMTLADIFSSEKISAVSFFDGKIWNNPFVGPENEGDNGENYDGEIPCGDELADEAAYYGETPYTSE